MNYGPIRVAGFMLGGAFAGFIILGMPLLEHLHGYDHGQGETLRCDFAAAIIGAFGGLTIELVRRAKKAVTHYGTRDAAMLLTLVAIALGCSVAALEFAAQNFNW